MALKLYDVGDKTAVLLSGLKGELDKMTAWMVAQAGDEVSTMQELFFSMAEQGQNISANPPAKNSLAIDAQGKVYLPADEMLESVFHMFETPQIDSFIKDAARCVCRARTCSTTPQGCDLGKPIRDASILIAELFPQLRDGPESLDPEQFLSKFISAYFLFGSRSPFFIGNECTHFCESACTQAVQSHNSLHGQVQISSMERTMELFGRFIGKTESNPYGLLKYFFLEPEADLVAKNGQTSIGVIGTGPASMQYAWKMRQQGYQVTMYERSSHQRDGETYPNFGGVWFDGIPYDKRGKEDLMTYYALMTEMGIEVKVAEIGKDISVSELQQRHQAIFSGAGVSLQPVDLRVKGEKDADGKDLPGITHAMPFLRRNNMTVVNHVTGGGSEQQFDIKRLAEEFRGETVLIVGGGDTEKDCSEWMAKFKHALDRDKSALDDNSVRVLVLERSTEELANIRAIHGGVWPSAPATLHEVASLIQGHAAGVERRHAVVINEIRQAPDGRLEVELDFRKLESLAEQHKEKSKRKYVSDHVETITCDTIIKAIGFNPTSRRPSQLDAALGSVEDGNVNIVDNRACEPGVYYGGDNNTSDPSRASRSATLVAAMEDGRRAAERTMRDIEAGLNMNPEAWQQQRSLSGADHASNLRRSDVLVVPGVNKQALSL